MIISHKHKFIFIKTRKTAGTSIEIFLEQFCGDADIITPIFGSDEDKGNHVARNNKGFYNHIGAFDIRRLIGDAIWSSYFKFAFERNPWDKQVSMYWWRKHQYDLIEGFEEYCVKSDGNRSGVYLCPSDYHLYSDGHAVAVDFIGRYEALEADLGYVLKMLDLPDIGDLPAAKSRCRPKVRYWDMYDEQTAEIVRSNFADEIGYFGYKF